MKVSAQGEGWEKPVIDGTVRVDLVRRKRIYYSQGLGFGCFGGLRLGDTTRFGGIYRSRRGGYGRYGGPAPANAPRYVFLSRSYAPTNPRTVPQQANRSKFADAVQAWIDLTNEEKTAYNKRGSKLGRVGRNLFISEYCKTH